MSKAEEYRQQARESEQRAKEVKSLKDAVAERRRAEGLIQLAENEDWLEGRTAPQH